MKLNIFSIPDGSVAALKDKFGQVGLEPIHTAIDDLWQTSFYFSAGQEPAEILWVRPSLNSLRISIPRTSSISRLMYLSSPGHCYVLTYGKSHFYVRPYCDHEFGIEIAKRLADENDIKQKASKKFAGRRKKEILGYASNTQLDIQSGESIDYLQAAITEVSRKDFGRTAKFGSSTLLNAPIKRTKLENC